MSQRRLPPHWLSLLRCLNKSALAQSARGTFPMPTQPMPIQKPSQADRDALGLALAEKLAEGAQSLALPLSPKQQAHLLAYLALLSHWNQVYNLTAVRQPQDMLTHHVLDSLAVIAPLLKQARQPGFRLLDVGSGAGLPGVVIAICCPQIDVTCVDAVAKKAAFVQQVAVALALPNLHSLHARVESVATTFPVITSRAFASLQDFTSLSKSALAEGGIWMALKGKQPVEELAQLPTNVQVFHVEPLAVPGLDAERCLVWMRAAR
jgi:16S rRNA (guanine527-N7)-methyltransferase